MACVNLTFVLPQILSIYFIRGNSDGFMFLPLVVFITCNLAASLGFREMSKKPDSSIFTDSCERNPLKVVLLFTLVGAVSYFMNRGIYHGGFNSGNYVIVNFFISYLQYALVLLLAIKNKYPIPRFLFYAILLFIIILYFDKVVLTGRRNDAIRIFIILLFFFFYHHKRKGVYKKFKWLVPFFFVAGMIFNTQIENYRNSAYEDVSLIDNLVSLDFTGAAQALLSNSENEVYNGMKGINYCSDISGYNFGAYDWNRIIHDFVPKALVGSNGKEALLFTLPTDNIEGDMTEFGNTFTGYYDAFASFWLFGFIKFLIIGLFMGYLWRRKHSSDICFMMYFCIITNCLHVPSHTTSYFTNGLIFFMIFVYPFIKYTNIKICRQNMQS